MNDQLKELLKEAVRWGSEKVEQVKSNISKNKNEIAEIYKKNKIKGEDLKRLEMIKEDTSRLEKEVDSSIKKISDILKELDMIYYCGGFYSAEFFRGDEYHFSGYYPTGFLEKKREKAFKIGTIPNPSNGKKTSLNKKK